MKTIHITSKDPYYNLALEEYLLKEKHIIDDVFFLWQNAPCIVIGRNQNPYNEVNLMVAESLGIPVVRRISGGGTVYHDEGNINFTFLTGKRKQRLNNYRFFVQPIIDILNNTGIPARFVAPSHIYVGDAKVSGNAQSFYKDKMMHHGTLLFNGNLDHLRTLLKPSRRYDTHAVDSTRATTTNLKEHLHIQTDVTSFMTYLTEEVLLGDVDSNAIILTGADHVRIQELALTKYQSHEWTYGETPAFWINETYHNEVIQLHVERGRIKESSIAPETLEGIWFLPSIVREALQERPDVDALLQILFQ